ncbi:CBL-INTERACTING SERINE/THREONINE-PROTEIN KINASE 14 [Salix viminalis]|uniref:non-specific serine/threonine protein kinase n=1 Tax=Salix viminalis TaxID=40686 RepID=A0A9Q0QLB7_SALVM|nr:CBL-INTERACTING SERINE/THREONINE-PROTEIN KINASE 14 [Salix viminalis]
MEVVGETPPASAGEVILFGKYELGKLLGYGAFAKVYHARNVSTGQSVAIKAVSKAKVRPDGLLHTLCGTPAYVAPELLAKKGYDGAKVDIWSCGVVLFVLIAGYLPFNDTNLMAMYRKIYKGTIPVPEMDVSRSEEPAGFKEETKLYVDDFGFDKGFEEDEDQKSLNAFDIISFSSGFDLSTLFDGSDTTILTERFVSAEKPEKVMEIIEEAAKKEGLEVSKRNNRGAILEGWDGNFTMIIEVHRLTGHLVMIEVKEKKFSTGPGRETWEDKLKPQIRSLIYLPEQAVSGSN